MRPFPPPADHRLRRLIGVAAALHASDAAAQDDPFALPAATGPDAPAREFPGDADIIYADVTINGVAKSRLVQLRQRADGLAIRNADAVFLGLNGANGAPQAFTLLSRFAGVTANYQARLTRLDLTVLRKSDGPNAVDLMARRSGAPAEPVEGRAMNALIVDYDAAVTLDRRGLTAAGLVGARFARGGFSAETSWQVNSRPQSGVRRAVRLDTAASWLSPAGNMRATLGDFVAVAPATSRSVRMGGLRLSTDFAARPDLVTYPLPAFDGSTAVPTGLDLIVNDRRFTAGSIEPGEFAVRGVPVPVGRNQVGVIVRNALGQEELRTATVYTARSMLTPGLGVSSANLGYVRRGYGRVSNDYGPLAFSGSHRRGITNGLTGEVSVEMTRGFRNVGASAAFTLGGLALVTLDGRVSRNERAPLIPGAPVRRGHLIGAAIESFGPRVSMALQGSRVSRDYDDLASATGDGTPFSRYAAILNFDLGKVGQLNLAAVRQSRPARRYGPVSEAGQRSSVVTASYRTQVAGRVNLFADLSYSRNDRRSVALLLGMSMQFGPRTTAQASASITGGRGDYQASIQRADPLPGDTGYRMSIGTGFVDRAALGVTHHATWGRGALEGEAVAGQYALRATAMGSLILADNRLFASNRISSGFAVVRTGKVGDVGVLRENRAAGRSDGSGRLLVTELPAYVPVKMSLDTDSLPAETIVRRNRARIAAPDRAGTMIDLTVERVRPVTLRLLGPTGEAVAPGTAVTLLPSGHETLVGFDGAVEINALSGDRELRIQNGAARCYASLPPLGDVAAYAQLGDLLCNAQIRPPAMTSIGRSGK